MLCVCWPHSAVPHCGCFQPLVPSTCRSATPSSPTCYKIPLAEAARPLCLSMLPESQNTCKVRLKRADYLLPVGLTVAFVCVCRVCLFLAFRRQGARLPCRFCQEGSGQQEEQEEEEEVTTRPQSLTCVAREDTRLYQILLFPKLETKTRAVLLSDGRDRSMSWGHGMFSYCTLHCKTSAAEACPKQSTNTENTNLFQPQLQCERLFAVKSTT